RFLDEAYDQAMATLTENRPLLDSLAEALLERETLDREEIQALDEGRPLPENGDGPPNGPDDAGAESADRDEGATGATGEGTAPREAPDESRVAAGREARRLRSDEAEADAS
nr:hypothetical protein [Gemmatimonadota bacterium]NIR78827.1 hypothetical protein [Gemmatimonadota bacterium]NIU31319.1 hypothetical protein [Gemmatimonadota bacterium]NIV61672.1 hypothetical protein [Gemmatimonadota bacterium]NIW64385.1 hypothetical protein [Gemmatimonadota bacterium]